MGMSISDLFVFKKHKLGLGWDNYYQEWFQMVQGENYQHSVREFDLREGVESDYAKEGHW